MNGMSVTNTIRDDVIYKDDDGEWYEEELTNEDIENKLQAEKKKAFLSFSYGCWCTSWARDALLRRLLDIKDDKGNIIKKGLDEYMIYADTDSLKLREGYDRSIIDDYNKSVEEKIKFVSSVLNIPFEKYCPLDSKGKKHMLGVFDYEGRMEEFITQGAKKYAFRENGEIKITVAGVPKKGAKALHSLKDFKDNFVFRFEDTGKNLLIYVDNQEDFLLEDYKGDKCLVTDRSGCCLLPTTYVLGKAEEYSILLTDSSSKRAVYKE